MFNVFYLKEKEHAGIQKKNLENRMTLEEFSELKKLNILQTKTKKDERQAENKCLKHSCKSIENMQKHINMIEQGKQLQLKRNRRTLKTWCK